MRMYQNVPMCRGVCVCVEGVGIRTCVRARSCMYVRECMRACLFVRARVCMHASVRACVWTCACRP